MQEATMQKHDQKVWIPEDSVVKTVQVELLTWYERHKRDLPWRADQDPYKIWVSEIMLQQTRVSTVIPYFERFIQRFPTLEDLAQATEEEVIKLWEGLGYYSRVRNLHLAVKEVSASYGGIVPDSVEEISKLKGVGPYTTGAILSIAYQKKVPAVDGNVMRVFSRLFGLYDDIASQATRKKMETIADCLIPESKPGDFNQALMELGAMVCTPTSPQCIFCPLQSVCVANEQGLQAELPQKKKAKPPVPVAVRFVVFTVKDHVLVVKRPEEGLLAGMWSLPTFEGDAKTAKLAVEQFCQEHNLIIEYRENIGNLEHIFSHRHWKIDIEVVKLNNFPFKQVSEGQWVPMTQLHEKAFPNVYRKAFSYINL